MKEWLVDWLFIFQYQTYTIGSPLRHSYCLKRVNWRTYHHGCTFLGESYWVDIPLENVWPTSWTLELFLSLEILSLSSLFIVMLPWDDSCTSAPLFLSSYMTNTYFKTMMVFLIQDFWCHEHHDFFSYCLKFEFWKAHLGLLMDEATFLGMLMWSFQVVGLNASPISRPVGVQRLNPLYL